MPQTILVIGGAGAQGSAIVQALASKGQFDIRVLTRRTNSGAAEALKKLSGVSLIEGDSSDVHVLRSAFRGIEICYANTNGFALGEKAELYWGVRMYELAREAGVKHYIYAGLPYVYKNSGYNPKYNTGHVDGKARVVEFISAQPTSPMSWTVINSCLYLEMLHSSSFAPKRTPDGTFVFASAYGDGAAPMITLPDLGLYTLWAIEHPTQSRGLILDTATEHVNWDRLVEAFTAVTGKKAVYERLETDEILPLMAKGFSNGEETRLGDGSGAAKGDPTLVKATDNFRAFIEVHRLAVAPSQGLWPVDYEKLDRILPGRVRGVREWFEKVGYTGEETRQVLEVQF